MKLTREQFDEIGEFYLDDFPLNSSDQDMMFNIFNHLPMHIKGTAIQWGFSDTVFRDEVFRYLCDKLLGMTCDEYYESDLSKDYFDNNVQIELDYNKFK